MQGRSVREVQVETDKGGVVDVVGEAEIQQAIWLEVHQKRFHLAEEAPICQGLLRGEFGYLVISPTAQSVLNGTYRFRPDTDQATRELMEECAQICNVIPRRSVLTCITRDLWQQRWRKAREDTSSSELGLHFGHYIAGADNDAISTYHVA